MSCYKCDFDYELCHCIDDEHVDECPDFDEEYEFDEDYEFEFSDDYHCCWHPLYNGVEGYCACKEHHEQMIKEAGLLYRLKYFWDRKVYALNSFITRVFSKNKTYLNNEDLPF